MSALSDDHLQLRGVDLQPEEMTRRRRGTEKLLGHQFAPFPAEIAAYQAAGCEPPTD
ncbi:hypothetical protein [Nocardia tengchongensis]|uniref:hypothetical protein n=1 Tax=Nocardia tengchongensis TaxID=2055889 RepID=UPI0036896154